MKALTLYTPWAFAVASGQKTVENRPWKPPESALEKLIAIHAGKKHDTAAIYRLAPAPGQEGCFGTPDAFLASHKIGLDDPRAKVSAAILGVARVKGYIRKGTRGYTYLGPQGRLLMKWDVGEEVEMQADPMFFAPDGNYGWKLGDFKLLTTPIPCKGALSLWTIPTDIEKQLRVELGLGNAQ